MAGSGRAMAGCGDVREFLSDEDVRNVPEWYERHLGIGRDVYDEMVGIDEALRPLEKRKEELKALVKSRMGEAQRAIGEGYVFSRSVSTSKPKLEIVAPEPKLGEIAAFLQEHSIPYVTKGGTVSVRLNKKGDKS